MNVHLGHRLNDGQPIRFDTRNLERHLHLIGATGSGKTTALITLLVSMFCQPTSTRPCIFIIDRLGGFSMDLLRWFSSIFCPPFVRDRLVYLQPAREDLVVPMNPLQFETLGEGYFRVARTIEMILQGWASQDISQMPRLARWLYNAFWAVAQLGLTIGDTVHLLSAGSELHKRILEILPESLRWEWRGIYGAHGSQAEMQLESSRNRLRPIFEAPFLRATFSSSRNFLDVLNWMRSGKIVLINLGQFNTLHHTMGDTIGGLILNEITNVTRSLPPGRKLETLVVLDEFQRFVGGSDLEYALAESRQMKLRLVLSHQSFSQLRRDDVDLTSLIFQAQNRLMLKVHGPDATLLAEELAALNFDPKRIKDEIYSRRQKVTGHRIVELHNWSKSEQMAKNWQETHGRVEADHENRTWRDGKLHRTVGDGISRQRGDGKGGSEASTSSHGGSETLVPILEEYSDLSSRTYYTFQELALEAGRELRELSIGQGLLQQCNQHGAVPIQIRQTAPGHLAWPWERVEKYCPTAVEAYHRLLEKNFAQECFVAPDVIERETRERLQRVLQPQLSLGKSDDEPARSPFEA